MSRRKIDVLEMGPPARRAASISDAHTSSAGMLSVAMTTKIPAPERKKGAATTLVRKWLRYDAASGQISLIQADKTAMTHKLGVQLRDLRVLDPQLATSYPSAILCRDRALVVNLEYIKCIVALDHVLVLNAESEIARAFLEELQKRLAMGGSQVISQSYALLSEKDIEEDMRASLLTNGAMHASVKAAQDTTSELPFELRVLEAVLDMVSSFLDRQTSDLEAAAHPALDALTAKVGSANLERVRRIKNRMVRLTTNVETVREVLEKFLDDDSDMRNMNLSAKLEQEELHKQSSTGQAMTALGPRPSMTLLEEEVLGEEAVEAVEMLLETYFMQVDNTYNKLQTLCEYIDDTEDYINIELDNQRNQLIQLELLITAATLCITMIAAVAGIFGMNINNRPDMQDPAVQSYPLFLQVTLGTVVGAIVCFVSIVLWCRYKQILN